MQITREEVKKICGMLLGATDVAEFTGIDRHIISVYKNRSTFPKPICHIGKRPVWFKPDIEYWMQNRKKLK